ncbi:MULTISPECIES: amidohydrolase family protein [Streptomyces]|uniref:Amidohydrolase family protein n=1 Tax=Streptomyces lonegramiae TaxID=3075524 RepID=A0ABU2XG68_9ACTN|nr:amidohydrolase family protein [Streptomyces sp. DSM 41529]MDT0544827.1 amidohydrolase family protein [Streptomyces sp. DSM 41529]
MPRIDAHHHLWDLARRDQPWMDGPWADPIHRTFTLEDLEPHLGANGVDATVVVQSSSSHDETVELLAVAHASARVAGVVGWADLTDPALPDVLAALRAAPGGDRLVGLRHQVQDEPDRHWLARPDVRRGLAHLADADLAYDLLITPRELPAAIDAVRDLPGLRFVLDHAAKPPVASGARDPWDGELAALAALPNVVCKLSGLVTEAAWDSWLPEHVLPYAEHVLDTFGPDRVLFGSDWPVCTLAATYDQVVDLADRATRRLTEAERAAVFGTSATRAYGLGA